MEYLASCMIKCMFCMFQAVNFIGLRTTLELPFFVEKWLKQVISRNSKEVLLLAEEIGTKIHTRHMQTKHAISLKVYFWDYIHVKVHARTWWWVRFLEHPIMFHGGCNRTFLDNVWCHMTESGTWVTCCRNTILNIILLANTTNMFKNLCWNYKGSWCHHNNFYFVQHTYVNTMISLTYYHCHWYW